MCVFFLRFNKYKILFSTKPSGPFWDTSGLDLIKYFSQPFWDTKVVYNGPFWETQAQAQ